MRESLFSNQVIVPFHLQNPFPLYKDKTDDRIFKTVSFRTDQNDITLQLKAINNNLEVVSELNEKEVNLSIPARYWDPKTRLRVKAKLAMEIDGVKESHWVTQQDFNYSEASHYNQYRLRGVSNEGYVSDWVYSEARDDENDLIIYELLYDLIDLIASVQDEELEYLIDHMVSDTFQTVLQSGVPKALTGWFFDEEKRAKLNEWIQLLASLLKQDFTETILSSPKEFAMLAKTYQLLETYRERQTDFLSLLMEAYLEERYEQLIQKTNFEVILQNDEEMQLFFQSIYSFDIKSELITHAYDLEPNDRFVITLNDAVKLISEPIVYEQLVSSPNEELIQFLRLALQEIFVPLLVMDVRGAELEHELEDQTNTKPLEDVIEVDLLHENETLKYLLVKDLFDSFISDLTGIQHDYEIEILEKMIDFISYDKVSLFIEYAPIELIEFLTKMKENFDASYTKLKDTMTDVQIIQTKESVMKDHTIIDHSLKELYQLKNQEWHELSNLVAQKMINDELYIKVIDAIFNQFKIKETVKEPFSIVQEEELHSETTLQEFKKEIIQKVFLHELILKLNQKQEIPLIENITMYPNSHYENLIKPNLFHLYINPYIEHKEQALDTYLYDHYIMNGEEIIQYVLGDLGSEWPIGKFILGTNTLKGDGNPSTGESQ